MIRFSVIIPLYNKANFVQKTIESVLNQTFNDFEVIIVNDGSTDNSLAVVNRINDPRIRIFSKENGGVSIARNFGIKKALYDFITFLDADDLWLPDFLETIKGMIEHHSQAGIFATGYTYINHLGNKLDMVNTNLPKGAVVFVDNYCRALIKKEIAHFCTGTICVKRKLFDIIGGFREGVKRGEDLDMWVRLSIVSSIVWKNEPKLLVHGFSENNATFNNNSFNDEFPYWEWYAYSTSIYLKIYTHRTIKFSIKQLNYRDKISILSKINWYYVLLHLFYYLGQKVKANKK